MIDFEICVCHCHMLTSFIKFAINCETEKMARTKTYLYDNKRKNYKRICVWYREEIGMPHGTDLSVRAKQLLNKVGNW